MVKVDYKRDKYLSKFSIKTLEDRYLLEGEKSPQDAFARAAQAFADDDDHAADDYANDDDADTADDDDAADDVDADDDCECL